MRFGAVIFDFDGLIIDSESPLFEIWQEIYRDHAGDLTLGSWQHALGTQHGFDPYAELRSQTGVTLDRDTWMPKIRDEHWRRCEGQPLLPGVSDRLDDAARLGMPAAVASSSNNAWVLPWLARHGLDTRLQAVCTRDDVAAVKPAPDLFLLAARRLGVPPERCLVFEDSPNGLLAAKAASMWAVAVPNALTSSLALPAPDLVLTTLDGTTLEAIDALLGESRRDVSEPSARDRKAMP